MPRGESGSYQQPFQPGSNVYAPNSPMAPRVQTRTPAPTPAAPAPVVPPPGPTPPPAGQPGINAGPPPSYWNPSIPGIFQAPGVTPMNKAPKGYNWNQTMANTLVGGTL